MKATQESLWRLEPLPHPREAHAADAVEIVAGEIVRRVTLSRIDYAILCQRNDWLDSHQGQEPAAHDLSGFPHDVISAALRRLAAAGLMPFPEGHGLALQ